LQILNDDGNDPVNHRPHSRARDLRNYLIAGLLIWIPVMVTVWVIRFLSGILDQSLLLLPWAWRPETLFGRYIPGVGIVLSLLLLLVTGIVVRNLFGGQIVAGIENLVRRIPVVGSIYGGAKTFSETVLTDKGKSFKQVVLVEASSPARKWTRSRHGPSRTSSASSCPRRPTRPRGSWSRSTVTRSCVWT
jgi:uncharacterized membrane protein